MSSGQIDEECASALENLYSCARYARGGCRRAALLRHFNEADAIGRLCGGENCCDVCDKGTHKCAAAPACDSSLVADALAVIAEAAQGEKARPLTINMAADRLGRKATGKQLSKPARECARRSPRPASPSMRTWACREQGPRPCVNTPSSQLSRGACRALQVS